MKLIVKKSQVSVCIINQFPHLCTRFVVSWNHLCVQDSCSTKTIYVCKVHGQPKPSMARFMANQNHPCARFMVNQNHLCLQGLCSSETIYVKVSRSVKTTCKKIVWLPRNHLVWWLVVNQNHLSIVMVRGKSKNSKKIYDEGNPVKWSSTLKESQPYEDEKRWWHDYDKDLTR